MTPEEKREYERARKKRYYEEHVEELKAYQKEYQKKNKEKITKKRGAIRKRENDESKEYAEKHRVKWTPEEVSILVEMISRGESYKDIAYTLGRTIFSISTKIKKLRKVGIIE